MSQLLETIARELGPTVLSQVGSRVGATPQQTQAVVAAALPLLVAALAKNASQPGGATALADAVDRDHTPSLLDQLGPLAGALLGGGGGTGGGGGGLGALLAAAAGAMGSGASGAPMPKALAGDKILGHVLGDGRGAATKQVAAASGVDASTVAALLPVLAPIVMSALGTTKKDAGLDAGGLASFLQGQSTQLGGKPRAAGGSGDLGSLLGKLFG